VRLVARVQLVAKVLDVALDSARRNAQLLGALLGREAARNAFKHLALSLG
jgi:hypothetical protein